jgi:hypothetical protein
MCPSRALFELFAALEDQVISPMLMRPRCFCLLKQGLMGAVRNAVKAHYAFEDILLLLEDVLFAVRPALGAADVRKWANALRMKMVDHNLRSAANEFAIGILSQLKGLRNVTGRMSFRNQELTGKVKMLAGYDFP